MREVFVIKAVHKLWLAGGNEAEISWLYGKGDTAVPEKKVTDAWLAQNGYRSRRAAESHVSGIPHRKNHPWSAYGATVERKDIEDKPLRYKIHRCYEIVILDEEDNQVGESEYCYRSRRDAEHMAESKLREALEEYAPPDAP